MARSGLGEGSRLVKTLVAWRKCVGHPFEENG